MNITELKVLHSDLLREAAKLDETSSTLHRKVSARYPGIWENPLERIFDILALDEDTMASYIESILSSQKSWLIRRRATAIARAISEAEKQENV